VQHTHRTRVTILLLDQLTQSKVQSTTPSAYPTQSAIERQLRCQATCNKKQKPYCILEQHNDAEAIKYICKGTFNTRTLLNTFTITLVRWLSILPSITINDKSSGALSNQHRRESKSESRYQDQCFHSHSSLIFPDPRFHSLQALKKNCQISFYRTHA